MDFCGHLHNLLYDPLGSRHNKWGPENPANGGQHPESQSKLHAEEKAEIVREPTGQEKFHNW